MTATPMIKTAAPYTAQKIGSRWHVWQEGVAEAICYLSNREVDAWLFRAAKAFKEEQAYNAEVRAHRLEQVKAYLANRGKRPAAAQLSLF